jgi:hypothetical protein
MTKNWGKKFTAKKLKNFDQKIAMYYPWTPIKLQKKLPAFKRTPRTSKLENYLLFSIFESYFCPPGSRSGSSRPKSMRIRIHYTDSVVVQS